MPPVMDRYAEPGRAEPQGRAVEGGRPACRPPVPRSRGRWAVSRARPRHGRPRLSRLSAMRYLIGGEYGKRDVPAARARFGTAGRRFADTHGV
jgi:hypothetical protein